MRRFLIVIFFLILIGGCWAFTFNSFQSSPISPLQASPTPSYTAIPSIQVPSVTPTPFATPTSLPVTVTTSPTIPATPLPTTTQFTVYYHPDDMLYVGDLVSFEVVSPPGVDVQNSNLHAQVDPPDGPSFSPVKFGPWGIEGRSEAAMIWAWDTHNFDPGTHTIAYSVQPQDYTWSEQVSLLPSSDLPPDQADARWASTHSQCCQVFYVTNTASQRDLTSLTALIDEQARSAIDEMNSNFTQPITVTLLPRLLGNGGFTSDEISVSYLDRNYAATSWSLVVHHEMIHTIDGHLGGDFRPTMLVEGLAVYETGGHYKPEQLMPRAAALLEGYLNWYIPLKTLADDFYASQHEIGYLEAASLIEYMVHTYSWEAYSAFYRDIHSNQGEKQSDAIDTALRAHFSITFDQLERNFLSALKAEPDTLAWVDDVRLTVTFFETMRRYQQLLDPSAYFRTAWLLDNKAMRERSIVADYLRHPHTPENLALETLFITASQQMSAQQYADASQTLEVINSVLGNIEHGTTDPFSASEMAADYLTISATAQQAGYEVQSINLSGERATIEATTAAGPDLITLHLQRSGGEWVITP